MGYTHYWTPKATDDKTWKRYVAACKKLHKELPETSETAGGYYADNPIKISGSDGTGNPEFTPKYVCFNGNEENDLDHETFYIGLNENDWSFCKTNRKPYDLLVCACLIAAKEILGYEVRSDGNFEDWQPAIAFYLDTIYDIQTMNQDEKNKLVQEVLPEFLLKNTEV